MENEIAMRGTNMQRSANIQGALSADIRSLYSEGISLKGLSALKLLYPKPSFIDVYKLSTQLLELQERVLFETYGYHYNENMELLVKLLPQLPENFLIWASEKDLGPKDLSPIRALCKNTDQDIDKNIKGLLSTLAEKSPSRQYGVKILELFIDLTLMDMEPKSLRALQEESFANWLDRLMALRYPQRFKQKKQAMELMRTLPWPKGVQASWVGEKDSPGVSLQLFIENDQDFKNKIDGLKKVAEVISKKTESLWKK